VTTRLSLGSCLSILCLFWARIRAAGLSMACSAPAGWSFIPTAPSSSCREVMGGHQATLAPFVPLHPRARGLCGTMARPVRWGSGPAVPSTPERAAAGKGVPTALHSSKGCCGGPRPAQLLPKPLQHLPLQHLPPQPP